MGSLLGFWGNSISKENRSLGQSLVKAGNNNQLWTPSFPWEGSRLQNLHSPGNNLPSYHPLQILPQRIMNNEENSWRVEPGVTEKYGQNNASHRGETESSQRHFPVLPGQGDVTVPDLPLWTTVGFLSFISSLSVWDTEVPCLCLPVYIWGGERSRGQMTPLFTLQISQTKRTTCEPDRADWASPRALSWIQQWLRIMF